MIEILLVEDEVTRSQFLQLPQRLFSEQPNWIASSHDDDALTTGLHGQHPFYQRAESASFVAVKDGIPVGRITAIEHQLYHQWHDDLAGYFGFFECIDDQEIADRLFTAADAWLRDRGLKLMRGPFQPSANYSSGCLFNNFETLPTIGTPWNPAYYNSLLHSCGFSKAKDLLSFSGHVEMLANLDPKFERTSKQAEERFGFRIRKFDMQQFRDDLRAYFSIFNEVFPHQWTAVPITESEIDYFTTSYRTAMVSQFTAIVELDGKAIGAVIGLPDLNPLLKESTNDLAQGWSSLAANRQKVSRVRIAVALVKPGYQMWGLGPAMNFFILRNVLADPDWNTCIQDVEYSWILEDNLLSRGTLQRGGATLSKTHRIYSREIRVPSSELRK